MTSPDKLGSFEEVRAYREARMKIVREKLKTIDLAQLRQKLVQAGEREMFIEPAMNLFENQNFLERLRDNMDHDPYSFGLIVRDFIAEGISRTTPQGWVEPMYVSGTRPSRTLCEAIRDQIVIAFGKQES